MRTLIAKAVFKASGMLGKIRYPQTVYTRDRSAGVSTPAGKQKLPHPWTYKLLFLSGRIDPEHWEHWALNHDDDPNAYPCDGCHGRIAPDLEHETEQ